MSTEISVFVSYAKPDKERVINYVDQLRVSGLNVWMDEKNILPGQNWDYEIRRAFDRADCVLAFISSNSFERRGYVQRELKLALDKRRERLIDDIYLVPVILDDEVGIPMEVSEIQVINASDPEFLQKVVAAIEHQTERLGKIKLEVQEEKDLYWSWRKRRESWDGLPGYEVEVDLIDLRSKSYANVGDIAISLNSDLVNYLFESRAVKFEQAPDIHSFAESKFRRTNSSETSGSNPKIRGRVVSFLFSTHYYFAGAAHGNQGFFTASYCLDPVMKLPLLEDMFEDKDLARRVLIEEVRCALISEKYVDDDGLEKQLLNADDVKRGISSWSDLASYCFSETSLDFYFSPYHVGCYAIGPQFASVEYKKIAPLMKDHFMRLLDIDNLKMGHDHF